MKMDFTTSFQGIFILTWTFLSGLAAGEAGYQRVSLNLHNQVRSKHCVGPLVISDDLNNLATQCASYYAKLGKIDHSCPFKKDAGENLWAQWGGSVSDDEAAKASIDGWYYKEEPSHNFNRDWQQQSGIKLLLVAKLGHFSQMVWKSSTTYGFGVARNGNMIAGVGLYTPHGNILNRFHDNVLPPCANSPVQKIEGKNQYLQNSNIQNLQPNQNLQQIQNLVDSMMRNLQQNQNFHASITH